MRTAKEYHETVEYIHWNPVKARLVSRPEDWSWSSVHDYSGSATGPMPTDTALVIDRVDLPMDPWAGI